LREADYVLSDADTPPVQSDWRPFVGVVQDRTHEPFGSIWLRTDLSPFLAPDQVNLMYIPTPLANLSLWMQGTERFSSGAAKVPLPLLRTPLLIPIGPYDPSREAIWVYTRVSREDGFFGPMPVYVGPRTVLEPAYEAASRMRLTMPRYIVALMVTMAALVGALWLMRREDDAYGWYALTMLLWAGHTAHQFTDRPLLPHELWISVNYLSLSWVLCELLFINRFFDLRQPRIERLVGTVTIALGGGHFLLSALGQGRFADALAQFLWTPWMMAVGALVLAQCIRAVRRRWSVASAGLLVITATFVVVGARDYLYEYYGAPGSTYYLQYFVLLPLGFFFFLLLRRFVGALRFAEGLNTELEARVADKARDLEQTYRRLGEEEKRREVAEARARLTRDMHDGLGGQLVHALALAQGPADQEALRQALRDALSDLRLILDSLSPVEEGFDLVFASFRHRVGKILARAGIEVHWDVHGLDGLALSSEQTLGLLRILQEATTNVVRHSGARNVHITARHEPPALLLRVSDDGRGIEGDHPGRGLLNMRIRAQELGAALSIASDGGGTDLECRLEVDAPNP
jgi:signal transduction histidine kinase